jgi:hypothetical protein
LLTAFTIPDSATSSQAGVSLISNRDKVPCGALLFIRAKTLNPPKESRELNRLPARIVSKERRKGHYLETLGRQIFFLTGKIYEAERRIFLSSFLIIGALSPMMLHRNHVKSECHCRPHVSLFPVKLLCRFGKKTPAVLGGCPSTCVHRLEHGLLGKAERFG